MHAQRPVTILVADDHPLFRRGLCDAIQRSTTYEIVAEAGDGEEAYGFLEKLEPRIAILDIEMPKQSGLEVARRANGAGLSASIIILTMHDEQSAFDLAMDAGVAGYMLKETAVPDILHGLEKVAAGESYVSPALNSLLMQRDRAASSRFDHRLKLDLLTAVERRVLRLIADGLSNREIAGLLSISTRTVEGHRYHICGKIGISGSHTLLRFAMENKAAI